MINNLIDRIINRLIIEIKKENNMNKIENYILLPIFNRFYYKFGNYIVFTFLIFIFQFIIIFYILIILLNKNN